MKAKYLLPLLLAGGLLGHRAYTRNQRINKGLSRELDRIANSNDMPDEVLGLLPDRLFNAAVGSRIMRTRTKNDLNRLSQLGRFKSQNQKVYDAARQKILLDMAMLNELSADIMEHERQQEMQQEQPNVRTLPRGHVLVEEHSPTETAVRRDGYDIPPNPYGY